MRLLIVEDQPDLGSNIIERLARSGYGADQVGTLAEALEAVRDNDYPLILLDRRLPDGDGASILPEVQKFGRMFAFSSSPPCAPSMTRSTGSTQGPTTI